MIKYNKILFFLLSLFTLLQADSFLNPEDAFKTSMSKDDKNIHLKLVLAQNIYVYNNSLIIKVNNQDITKKLTIKKPIEHHETLVYFNSVSISVPLNIINEEITKITFGYQGCSELGVCYQPLESNWNIKKDNKKQSLNEVDTISQTLQQDNIWIILVTFFGFGLLLSLTPCIFPMIPILSSIIVNASKNGIKMSASKGLFLSLIYVLSMSLAYTIAGVIAGLFGANIQVILQDPYVLIGFALVFVALAFSMFGYYTIELPQSLQNRLNKTTDGKNKNGVFGIAIMGFLSALIVGPCVAPPLAGALIYIGQTGDAVLGGLALFVLSLGMGAPLLIIGAGAGKFMPSPSGWMNRVSQIFGVIMLGIAIWMLERVIDASIILALWSLLLIGSAIFMGLFDTHKENTRQEYRLIKVLASFIFLYGVMLFIGFMTNATNPLNPLEKLILSKNITTTSNTQQGSLKFIRVKTVTELDRYIQNTTQPIMLDFYANWCISCKELEHDTFSNSEVISRLDNFTLLQVDVTKNSKDDKALLKKFNLFGPPAIIFWNNKGTEIKSARVVGYKNSQEFISHLDKHYK